MKQLSLPFKGMEQLSFNFGDLVEVVGKSIGQGCPHQHRQIKRIREVNVYPHNYIGAGGGATPSVGEKYYVINGYYYLGRDLEKV